MKTKYLSILLGVVNGGILSMTPLFTYNYLLSRNVQVNGGTDIAIQGAIHAILLILILNIITLTVIYNFRTKGDITKSHVFIFEFNAWIIATVLIALTFGGSAIFNGSEYGENIEMAFAMISIGINLISMVIATIIAKIVVKIINMNGEITRN